MKKLTSQVLLTLLLVISISAQTEDQKPVLLDEFGSLGLDELMARLDNVIFTSLKTPNTKAYIRIFSSNENCFLCRYNFGSLVDAYLKNTRKISTERYKIEYCDENSENLRTQLYLLSPTLELLKCKETVEVPKISTLFETVSFFYKDNKLSPLEDAYIEIGPSSNGEYSVNVLKKVKSLLNELPESKIHIIVYLGTNPTTKLDDKTGELIENATINLDKKSTAKKMLLKTKEELVKNGINSSQIETAEGGYVDGARRLEFWFIPKGGEIPKPKPDYFPKK